MTFFNNLFSPDTYETFSRSNRDVSGFVRRQLSMAQRIQVGDRFVCYMTKLSRWIGVLEVLEGPFIDESPLFYLEGDPYVVRFKVRPVVWLPRDQAIPIREKSIWDALSFTKGVASNSPMWTGKVRTSLTKISDEDGLFLQAQLLAQQSAKQVYPVDEDEYRRLLALKVRREDKVVPVTVPSGDEEGEETGEQEDKAQSVRESAKMQALLASIGEKMGFKVWLPKGDRTAVLREWAPAAGTLIDVLPLNYNEPTLQTIEQIDVLWLKGRSIARAFEVEHTTAV